MPYDGAELGLLAKVLASAFPDVAKLKHVVQTGLNKTRAAEPTHEKLAEAANEEGWAWALFVEAFAANPNNQDLKDAAPKLLDGGRLLLPSLAPLLREHYARLEPAAWECYRDSCPPYSVFTIPNFGGDTYKTLNYAYAIGGSGIKSSQHDLLTFVQALIDRVGDGAAREALRNWARGVAASWKTALPPPPRRLLIQSQRYVVVDISVCTQNDGTKASVEYQVRAWLIGSTAPPGSRPKRRPRLEDMETCIQEIWRELREEGLDADLLVEVFLPGDLIPKSNAGAADDWIVPDIGSLTPVNLGCAHPLVLRVRDRWENPGLIHRIRERWAAVGDEEHPCHVLDVKPRNPQITVWVDPAKSYPDPEGILRNTRHEKTVCGVLHRAPSDKSEDNLMLRAMLWQGLPIVIWDRDPGADLRKVKSMVNKKRLKELPEYIYGLRRDAPRDRWGLGKSLTLIYDDPDRPPLHLEKESRLKGARQ